MSVSNRGKGERVFPIITNTFLKDVRPSPPPPTLSPGLPCSLLPAQTDVWPAKPGAPRALCVLEKPRDQMSLPGVRQPPGQPLLATPGMLPHARSHDLWSILFKP